MRNSASDEQIKALNERIDVLSVRISELRVDLVSEINSQRIYLSELIKKEGRMKDGYKH